MMKPKKVYTVFSKKMTQGIPCDLENTQSYFDESEAKYEVKRRLLEDRFLQQWCVGIIISDLHDEHA